MDLSLKHPDGNISAFLSFLGTTYQLSQVKISFRQSTDKKGEPQAEIQGGVFLIVLSQVPDDNLLYWASNQWARKDGEVVFRNETGTPPLRIIFRNAYCVKMEQEFQNIGGGAKTIMVVSAETLRINDVLLENEWNE